jgi:predicted AAA+ superfamily ATPase
MESWFKVVRPHDDIRAGNLAESVFAANLAQVERNEGPEVYRNEQMFFAKTFFTSGMRNLAKQVVQGLNKDKKAGNRIISLQTGFGGGIYQPDE